MQTHVKEIRKDDTTDFGRKLLNFDKLILNSTFVCASIDFWSVFQAMGIITIG